jgi:hypothetical protein
MRAQVVLKPSESKYLISKAVVNMDVVKKAVSTGTVVLHPSSSTYFIVKEITGEEPLTRHWIRAVYFHKAFVLKLTHR